MLQRLIFKLDCEDEAITRKIRGDMLQGVLMEHINTDYADKLHSQGINPYSQYLDLRRDRAFWVIQTLTETAACEIIEPLLSPEFNNFHLERLNTDIKILEKNQDNVISMKDMVNRYYFEQSERIFRVRFITPTAFKSGGEYVFKPNLRLIFGSLMRKHSAICEGNVAEDTQTLDSILDSVKIISYNLRSVYSEIGRTRLPAFWGAITIKASGSSSFVNYMNFLLRFGEYSGVGIKCSMGMGAMKILDRTDKRKRKIEND